MAANLPSSFASAAAGQTRDDTRQAFGRNDSTDWSRKLNGTGTFRRTSTSLNAQAQNHQNAVTPIKSQGTQMPPTHTSQTWRAQSVPEGRFSKEELLHIFRTQRAAGELDKGVDGLLFEDFAAANHCDDALPGWARKADDHKSAPAVTVCWHPSASSLPLNLEPVSPEESEVCVKPRSSCQTQDF